MTNVSKNLLDSEIQKKLRIQFAKFFSDQLPIEIEELFSELLTDSEQIMLMKRLAAVILLHKGETAYSIPKTLKMSISTVQNIQSQYFLGKYDALINRYENKKFNSEALLRVLESLLSAGMPSLGKDRWKSLR